MPVLGSPAQIVRPKSATQTDASKAPPFPLASSGLSSPFALGNHRSAFAVSASPTNTLGSPVSVGRSTCLPSTSTPPCSKAQASQNVTPDCPPAVNLGADSVPRFPTPNYANDSPLVFPQVVALPSPLILETPVRNSTDKGGSSILGRLRSKSRSGKDAKPVEAKRERRFSISDRLNSVLKRKQKQEDLPPLPVTPGGITTSASTNVIDDHVKTKPKTPNLSRSASSPNFSTTPPWKSEPLPALPFTPSPGKPSPSPSPNCIFSSWETPSRSAHVEPINTALCLDRPAFDKSADTSDMPSSPSSLPSLSPSSSKSASFCTVSSGSHLQTPGLPSSPSFHPPGITSTPPQEPGYFPFSTPVAPVTPQRLNKTVETSTPRTQTANNLAAFGFQPAADDVPLAGGLRAQAKEKEKGARVPFQFVPAEMSKKPLKKGRSTPDLRQPYRRPPSVASFEYYGHPLLPQSDEGVRQRMQAAEPLPPFVEQSVLAWRPVSWRS